MVQCRPPAWSFEKKNAQSALLREDHTGGGAHVSGGTKHAFRRMQYACLNKVKNFRTCVILLVGWDVLSKTRVETLTHCRGYFLRKMVAPLGFP